MITRPLSILGAAARPRRTGFMWMYSTVFAQFYRQEEKTVRKSTTSQAGQGSLPLAIATAFKA
jgi:hypothetical protein